MLQLLFKKLYFLKTAAKNLKKTVVPTKIFLIQASRLQIFQLYFRNKTKRLNILEHYLGDVNVKYIIYNSNYFCTLIFRRQIASILIKVT